MMSSQKPLQEWVDHCLLRRPSRPARHLRPSTHITNTGLVDWLILYFQKPLARHESKGMTVSDLSSRASLTQGQQPQDSDDDSSDSLLDEVQETIVNKAWGSLRPDNDQILFGLRKTGVETSALHPEQVHIFKLWQIYLENVNPLLKVTHTPTLQGRIIDAASRVGSMDPSQAALMFSIYCMSISSLDDRECRAIFATPKEQLLIRYQLGCQQSLLNAGFLRSGSRDCLIALFLYLVSPSSSHCYS